MGLFGGLFGGKKEVNIENILKSVEKNGGQAVVQIPIKVFAKYMHENGEQKPTEAGSVKGFLTISGEKRKVGFQYGPFMGLQEGETIVTVFEKSGIEENLENLENVAVAIAGTMLKNITSRDMAVALAYGLVCNGTLGGTFELPKDIDNFSLRCSGGLTPFDDGYREAVNLNIKYNDYFNRKSAEEIREPIHMFLCAVDDICDENKKREFCFAVVREVISKWGLA